MATLILISLNTGRNLVQKERINSFVFPRKASLCRKTLQKYEKKRRTKNFSSRFCVFLFFIQHEPSAHNRFLPSGETEEHGPLQTSPRGGFIRNRAILSPSGEIEMALQRRERETKTWNHRTFPLKNCKKNKDSFLNVPIFGN